MIHKIKKSLLLADYSIKNFILSIVKKVLFKTIKTTSIHKILLFRTGSLGDSICALPAINALSEHFKNTTIDILANAGKGSVAIDAIIGNFTNTSSIRYDSVTSYDLFKDLKKRKYDLFVELPQDGTTIGKQIRNMLFVRLLGIKYAFGWEIASTKLFSKVQSKEIVFKREPQRLLSILEKEGIQASEEKYSLNITDDDRKYIDTILPIGASMLISIAPGAKRLTNRWNMNNFIEVKNRLIDLGFSVVLIGGVEDNDLVKPLCGDGVINFVGQLSVLQSAALLEKSLLLITNDSGPMHLSYAVNTPLIAIFSCRDYPRKWYPPEIAKNIVLRAKDIDCECCFLENCPHNNKCMDTIQVEEVIQKIIALLATINIEKGN